MGLFDILSAGASIVKTGFDIYSGRQQVSAAEDASDSIRAANAESRKARALEATKRRRNEAKTKLVQIREARKVRAQARSAGVRGGRSASGSSFAGFEGSIISTSSSNLGTLNFLGSVDESIFQTFQKQNIFANEAEQSRQLIKTIQARQNLVSAGVKALPVANSIFQSIKRRV